MGHAGGLLRGLPYRPNVTTSGRGKCSVLTGEPGTRARADHGRLLLAACCVHSQLAQQPQSPNPKKRAATATATTYVYVGGHRACYSPAAQAARGATAVCLAIALKTGSVLPGSGDRVSGHID